MNAKAASQRYQRQVLDLVRQPGNDVCADCKGRNPRWASHSLGVFLCIQCAGIHRKMGTHISKVKSLTLDEWNKEQVDRMKQMGNIKSNAYYNPDEKRNRPPMNAEEAERDSELERHIRDKYQRRKFIGKLPPPVPVKEPGDLRRSVSPMPSSPARHQPQRPAVGRSTSSSSSSSLSPADGITRSRTAPIVPSTWREAKRAASPLPALPAEANAPAPPAISISTAPQAGSAATAASLATPASASSLYPVTTSPYLPPRASSAQGVLNGAGGSAAGSHFNAANGVGQAAGAAAPLSPNSQFEGRSSVFDDLLSLTKPQQEQQQQAQQLGGMAFGQQQMMAGPSGGMMGGGGMGNPWAHLQQQQQPFANQQMAPMQTGYVNGGGMAYGAGGGYGGNFGGMDASGLGSMAFGQMQQQPQQQMQQPMMTGYPNGYGSGAFNGSPAPPSPSNPFFQQQQQQPQQQQYYSNGAGTAGQQPVDPYSARATMDQQRLQSGQVFDDWAKGMMPTNAGRR